MQLKKAFWLDYDIANKILITSDLYSGPAFDL